MMKGYIVELSNGVKATISANSLREAEDKANKKFNQGFNYVTSVYENNPNLERHVAN